MVAANGNIQLGGFVQTSGNVALSASGFIADADSDGSSDVLANGLLLLAADGIGTAGNAIETTVTTLTASAGAGGIFLAETDSLSIGGVSVTVSRVEQDATLTALSAISGADVSVTGGGALVLSAGGALTLTEGGNANAKSVNVSGGGTVHLKARQLRQAACV
ncbi:MAG: hypothetical protein EBS01_11395 [Verrucomicrobia bacterium]|nr:hypothetical protein [Verrucomicrobiota bacterium]